MAPQGAARIRREGKMSYTVEQVQAAIADEFEDYESEFYSGMPADGFELPMLGDTAYEVDSEGGSEGGGEYMHFVFRIGDQLFRKFGTHDSWNGNDWDGDLEEVESYEVTVTRFRKKK